MKAVQLAAIRRLEMRDVATPAIRADDDVLIRMAAVGVCGSDVHYFETGRIGSQVVQFPFTLGHEGAGVVEQVGKKVTRVKPGDRIAVDPAMSCFACDQCRVGRHHTCRKLRFLGCPGQAEGCLSEYLVMPQASCYPIPAAMTMAQAALSEPLAIGVYAVKQSVPMKGKAIGILGAGPIGLSVLLAAVANGAQHIYVTDRLAPRLALATKLGASWTSTPDKDDVVAAVTGKEPLLLDCVFECCGEQAAVDQGLRLLKPGGTLMLIGIPRSESLAFNMDLMRRREVRVQNVRRQVDCVVPALELIAGGTVDMDAMLTHRFALQRCQEAFELVAGYRDGVVKAMIEFEG
jgi:L-iditol 2-dehydrogenase